MSPEVEIFLSKRSVNTVNSTSRKYSRMENGEDEELEQG